MGASRIEAAVTDAGPLIHLAEINCLLLLDLFKHLYIPQAVWIETVGYGRVEESTLLQLKNLQRHFFEKAEIAQFIQDNSLQSLHTGECESLYLCQQTGTTLILTDDLAVRDAAKRLKITPVGSLGVVVRAYQVRLISLSEAENYILDLQNISSLFVTRAIVDLAIKTLHSHSGKT